MELAGAVGGETTDWDEGEGAGEEDGAMGEVKLTCPLELLRLKSP